MAATLSRRDFIHVMAAGSAVQPAWAATPPAFAIERLMIEWRQQPLALDTLRPRLRWTLATPPEARGTRQSAFHLHISDEQGGVVLDTGRVADADMAFQPAQDLPLRSQQFYRYGLQVWDQAGRRATAIGSFATGLITPADRRGQWLADGADTAPRPAIEGRRQPVAQATPLPLFRHAVQVRKPVRHAHLCIAGLGHYQLWIDDLRLSPEGLNGGWTRYDKRVLYDAYDLGAQLTVGEHRLGVALGNGFFNVEALQGRYAKLDGSFGRPQMWCQLRIVYTDGSEDILASGAGWQSRSGGTVYSSIYGGEDHDARLDDGRFGGDGWHPATVIDGPRGALQGSTFRTMVVLKRLPSRSATVLRPGVVVHDFGINHSGRPAVRFRGLQAGTVVRFVPAELLAEDGSADQQSMVGGKARGYRGIAFTYTARGDAEEAWSPQFTYTGYRYLQVEGVDSEHIDAIESHFLSADVARAGSFACSDRRLEAVHGLIRQALLSNSASVLTDCPQREKLGWLEQIYLNATTALMNSDMVRIYEKMAADIRDAQEPDGQVPTTAPEFIRFVDRNGKDTPFRDSPEWGAALILGAWAVYRLHGDRGILQQNYTAMARRLAFMATRIGPDGLIRYGLGDWYDIGPRHPGVAQLTSLAMTGTATYFAELTTMARIAQLLGTPDADRYAGQAAALRQTLLDRLFDADRAVFDTGSQTAQAMALVLDLVPPTHRARALAVLVDDIRARRDHVSAGDIGFHYVVRALTDAGRGDVLHAMLTRTDKPAYLEQINHGATSLTEAWDGWRAASQNHFMLGHAEIWLFQGLGGLDIDFSREAGAIRLAPQAVAGIDDQAASYDSVVGRIACRLRRDGELWRLDVDIPPGQTATVTLPGARADAVREKRSALARALGVSAVREGSAGTTLTAQSGRYEFSWRRG
ncbi:MAG: hypothetical protein EOP35_03945 [Rubrivivax sp.]|nr:MAG: hypothetical protein EOP35_03945 [Rubrivivax sp.]